MTNLTPGSGGQQVRRRLQISVEQTSGLCGRQLPASSSRGSGAGWRVSWKPLCEAPLAPGPLRRAPQAQLSVPGSARRPGRSTRGGSLARRLLRPVSGPSARPHPAGTEPERPGTQSGAGTPPEASAGGGRDSPVTRNLTKSYFAEGSAYLASRQEPGAGGVPWPRVPPADPLGSSAQPPHPVARERLPSAAQPPCAAGPHWLGQPGPTHGRLRPREAPPPTPLTPLVPSRYPAPGHFKLVKYF